MAVRLSVRPLLERATQVLAWTSGVRDLPAAANPFAGQEQRLIAAIPNPRLQALLAAIPPPRGVHPAVSTVPAVGPPATPTVNPPAKPPAVTGPAVVTAPPPANPQVNPQVVMTTVGGSPPNDPDALYPMAHQLFLASRYAEAVTFYNALLEKTPGHRAARQERATGRLWLGDLRGALADFGELAASDPNDWNDRRLKASLEMIVGNPRAALEEADALVRAQPNDPLMLLVQAQANLYAGDVESARQLFARVTQLAPTTGQALYGQANQMHTARVYGVAIQLYTSVLYLTPEIYGAYFGLGLSYEQVGQRQLAIDCFNNYLRFDTKSEFATRARQELQRLAGSPR
jgi:tetratricopeptide (TPR) repeat protein